MAENYAAHEAAGLMDITPAAKAGIKLLQAYGDGAFAIAGQVYREPLIVTADNVTVWDGEIASLLTADFAGATLLLIGGKEIDVESRAMLRTKGIIVEAMDAGAACRTFNVLLSEGRQVAAALIPV